MGKRKDACQPKFGQGAARALPPNHTHVAKSLAGPAPPLGSHKVVRVLVAFFLVALHGASAARLPGRPGYCLVFVFVIVVFALCIILTLVRAGIVGRNVPGEGVLGWGRKYSERRWRQVVSNSRARD